MARILVFLLLLFPVLVCAKPLEIFVSVPPLKTFVEKIAGTHARVNTMVSPGHNPATYEPRPQQISKLAETDLYIRVGVPFETVWMQRMASANPEMQVFDVREGLELRKLEHHDHEEKHADEMDPHVWTSPVMVKQILTQLFDILSDRLPQHKDYFEKNLDTYSSQLDELDQQILDSLQQLSNRRFLVFHPSWGYFAERYNLEQVAIQNQGKEPGARALADLINHARQQKVQVIFVQPQFSQQAATQIARSINATVIAIDPLSPDYINNLRFVTQQLAATLQ